MPDWKRYDKNYGLRSPPQLHAELSGRCRGFVGTVEQSPTVDRHLPNCVCQSQEYQRPFRKEAKESSPISCCAYHVDILCRTHVDTRAADTTQHTSGPVPRSSRRARGTDRCRFLPRPVIQAGRSLGSSTVWASRRMVWPLLHRTPHTQYIKPNKNRILSFPGYPRY